MSATEKEMRAFIGIYGMHNDNELGFFIGENYEFISYSPTEIRIRNSRGSIVTVTRLYAESWFLSIEYTDDASNIKEVERSKIPIKNFDVCVDPVHFEFIPAKEEKDYDHVNPDHYKTNHKEVWEYMIEIYGLEKFIAFCELNVFKYSMRVGRKPGATVEDDLGKIKWYAEKIKELRDE